MQVGAFVGLLRGLELCTGFLHGCLQGSGSKGNCKSLFRLQCFLNIVPVKRGKISMTTWSDSNVRRCGNIAVTFYATLPVQEAGGYYPVVIPHHHLYWAVCKYPGVHHNPVNSLPTNPGARWTGSMRRSDALARASAAGMRAPERRAVNSGIFRNALLAYDLEKSGSRRGGGWITFFFLFAPDKLARLGRNIRETN